MMSDKHTQDQYDQSERATPTTHNSMNLSLDHRVYLYILETALRRTTCTYEEIAYAVGGVPTSGSGLGSTLTGPLLAVAHRAHTRGWPPLTSIVVRKSGTERGLPGAGFWTIMNEDPDMSRERKRVLTEAYHRQVWDYFSLTNQV